MDRYQVMKPQKSQTGFIAKKDEPDFPDRDSRQIPAWHVLVLSVSTFSLYNIYWIYKTCSQLRDAAALCLLLEKKQDAITEETREEDREIAKELRREGRDAMMRLENNGTKDAFIKTANWPAGMFALFFAIPVANMIILLKVFYQVFLLLPSQSAASARQGNARFLAFSMALA